MGLLGHKTKTIPHIGKIQHPDILSIDQDPSFCHIIEACQQLDQRAFSGTCTTDHSQLFARPYRKRNVRQNIFLAVRIREINMIELYLADPPDLFCS